TPSATGARRRAAGLASLTAGRVVSARELVGSVEGGDLVAFGERRVVEDRTQEVVERAAEAEDGLSDVDQLGGAGADRMHAEQAMVLTVEQHLEHAAVVPEDLPAGDLAVARDAGLVRHAVLGARPPGPPPHGYLGNGIEPERKVGRQRAGGHAERAAGRGAALPAGGGGEAGVADDVPRREDVRHGGAERGV